MATGTIESKMTLLWTNSNTNTGFPAQTIPLDLTPYRHVYIITLHGINAYPDTALSGTFLLPTSGYYTLATMTNLIRRRSATITSTGIQFSQGVEVQTYNSGTNSNNVVVPYKIFGVK